MVAGFTYENTNWGGKAINASNFPTDITEDYNLSQALTIDAPTSNRGEATLVSLLGRANYVLKDRYIFTASYRRDGSSRFAPGNKFANFASGAVAWVLSEEDFIKNLNIFSNLKLRASYGQTGNQGINSYQTMVSLGSANYPFGGITDSGFAGDTSKGPLNKDLKWETTITRNIGFDFGFFNNRLTGTIDAYWNTTKDLLMKTTIPGITGFTATYANVGQTSNKGIEIALQGVLVQTKDWNVTAGFNINFNRGNVDELADNVTGLYGTQWASGSTFPSSDYILMEGKPVGLVRGLIADGFYTTSDFTYANGIYTLKEGIPDISSVVFPNYHLHSGMNERPAGQSAYPGMPKFKDRDNNGIINDDDVEVIGDMTPVHTGGFNINTSYKNFDLGLYFNWSYGNEIYNANKLGALYGYKESGVYENKLSLVKDCYKIYDVVGGQLVALTTPEQLDAANVNAKLPLAYSENGYVSTLGIEDGSYLRLNTLTLGYTLPKQFIKKAGISNLRVYGSIYNVFTITGYSGLDAEVNTNTSTSDYPKWGLDWGTYPRARSFVLGVNISF